MMWVLYIFIFLSGAVCIIGGMGALLGGAGIAIGIGATLWALSMGALREKRP
jgi:hypothetical protein